MFVYNLVLSACYHIDPNLWLQDSMKPGLHTIHGGVQLAIALGPSLVKTCLFTRWFMLSHISLPLFRSRQWLETGCIKPLASVFFFMYYRLSEEHLCLMVCLESISFTVKRSPKFNRLQLPASFPCSLHFQYTSLQASISVSVAYSLDSVGQHNMQSLSRIKQSNLCLSVEMIIQRWW